jgi:hypothetical protein
MGVRKPLIRGSSNAEEAVSKPKDIASLFSDTQKAHEKLLLILVNNAGIYDF